MIASFTTDEHRKLLGVLGRLGSSHDGERAAAGLIATRMLAAKRLSWADIIAPALPPPQPSAQAERKWRDDWHDDLNLCLNRENRLTEWEKTFVSSLCKRRTITVKQRIVLADIVEQLGRRCAA